MLNLIQTYYDIYYKYNIFARATWLVKDGALNGFTQTNYPHIAAAQTNPRIVNHIGKETMIWVFQGQSSSINMSVLYSVSQLYIENMYKIYAFRLSVFYSVYLFVLFTIYFYICIPLSYLLSIYQFLRSIRPIVLVFL